tara:strand:+ start:265 stop:1254 length:990 start_codon:yes stop_codon:yes gene_type:complete
MIVKSFELKKKDLKKEKYFLFYGSNKGLIDENINNTIKPLKKNSNVYKYDESEVIKDQENFEEKISNKSFFENEKLIIVNRCSDKIFKIMEEVIEKNLDDVVIILASGALEKKSKLRNLFEKNKKTICVPFYEDTIQSLNLLTTNFLKEKKISLSQQNINLITERCRGDRINLYNELQKIHNYSLSNKKIQSNDILKLTNLSENFDMNELVDNALAKNKKKTLYILNENNFASEDAILILRIFINKLKRLLKISSDVKTKRNIEEAISGYRPPVFWKDKDLLKKQIQIWNYDKILKLFIKVNNTELLIKKYPSNSTNLVTDFILDQANS